MEAYPKPRHQYIYTPRYGQRGVLSYAGQQPNGAYPAGVMPGGYGYNYGGGYGGYGGYGGIGMGMGMGVGVNAYAPAVPLARPYYPASPYYGGGAGYYTPSYAHYAPTYPGFYNYNTYGSLYPYANFYHPYQRTTYYPTHVPSYGYTAHVYPPGPSTTTTTYHVVNSQGASYRATATGVVRDTRPAYAHGHGHAYTPQGPTREDIQMENRRVATERGAYDARKIRPADARDDDPFWCRERNGEWHLRSYYQIENECQPGRWMMDAEIGFLVFHRE